MKATKSDVMKAMKNLRDKETVEDLKQHFYVKATCWKACETFGFDKGFDMSLELVAFLMAHEMISPVEMLEITTEVALMDYDEKEGDEHGKD